MDELKFEAILPIIIAALVDMIKSKEKTTDEKAIDSLYQSELYTALENEETKVWQYSTEKLYDLYFQEKSAGKLDLPEY